jgi:4-amino-4-deoxy-L-arabinose transferase-like glycosyltransferase
MSGVSGRLATLWLTLVIGTYLLVGVLFAVYTPDWQAPDEPAHYNYVRYLAEQGRFPVLQQGDYPQDYLEEIKSQKFPAHLSIDPIRYEFHQPPLYYLLAAPVYELFDGALLPLRLLSVILGGGLVYVAYRLVLAVCPTQSMLALGAAAFVAFVPMHMAMAAAVNNDTLAELLLALVLWGLIRYQGGEAERTRALIGLGVLLGLGLLTKRWGLVGVVVAVAAVALRRRRDPQRMVRELVWLLIPALLLALPWLARNVAVYGWPDLMGQARHDEVVLGQPTTAEWIADYGWRYLIGQGVRTTYCSFWGKFGWMAVLMDRRIYLALSLFAAVATAGFFWWLVSAWVSFRRSGQAGILNPSKDAASARLHPLTTSGCLGAPAVLLFLSVLLTVFSYLWYNTKFVQHQGRYLFPALIPLGLVLALGWWTVVRRAGALVARTAWPGRVNRLLFASPYAGLAALDIVCLFVFIVPYLS